MILFSNQTFYFYFLKKQQMGQNMNCCEVFERNLEKYQRIEEEKRGKKSQLMSLLPDEIKKVANEKNLFLKELNKEDYYQKVRLNGGMYVGFCNLNNQPEGFGIQIKDNNSTYIGYFQKGQASGHCFLVMEDGSYYQGSIIQGKANSKQGYYQGKDLKYKGGFKDSHFEGHGHFYGINFDFLGEFEKGKRKKGILKWKEEEKEFIYHGQFDKDELFTGKGTLRQPEGTYEGTFYEGKKEGTGTYTYLSGFKYEGEYKNNLKQGYGKIVSPQKRIPYCGQFKEGVPHGQGYGIDSMGNPYFLKWNQGLLKHQFE